MAGQKQMGNGETSYWKFPVKRVIPRKILYRVSGEKADGARDEVAKTRYNEQAKNRPKPLPVMSGRGKTRYNNGVFKDHMSALGDLHRSRYS